MEILMQKRQYRKEQGVFASTPFASLHYTALPEGLKYP